MADPEQLASIWAQAIQQFPLLGQKWGSEIPADPATRNAALGEYRNYLTPGATRAVEERRFRPDVHEMVQPIDPSTVSAPTYFTPEYWKNIGKRIYTGAVDVSALGIGVPPPTGTERLEELKEALPEGETPSFLDRLGTIASPSLEALQAIQDVTAPATGAIMARPVLQEPGVQERVDILKERGGAPGWLGDIERYASAYQQAVGAGEIPLKKQIPVEIATDPLELAPGGIALGAARRGLGLGGRALSSTAPMAVRAATQQALPPPPVTPRTPTVVSGSTTAAETVMGRGYFPRRTYVGGEEVARDYSRPVPFEAFRPEPDVVPELFSDAGAIQRALPLEDVPFEAGGGIRTYDPLRLPYQSEMFGGVPIGDIPAEQLLKQQAEEPSWGWGPGQRIGRETTPSGKRIVFKPDVTREMQEATPEIFEPRIPIGQQIQDLSPFSQNIPESVKPLIDKLINYRQRGVDIENPGFKRWQRTWTDDVARQMFGDATPANRAKVNDYIDSLPGQQELILPTQVDNFKQMEIDFQAPDNVISNEWQKWLDDYYVLDPETSRFIPKTNRPLPPTNKGWMGLEDEIELTEFIESIAPSRGSISAVTGAGPQEAIGSIGRTFRGPRGVVKGIPSPALADVPEGHPFRQQGTPRPAAGGKVTYDPNVSEWVRNKGTVESKIFDDARGTWRDYRTPSEIKSIEGGPLKTVKSFITGAKESGAYRTVLRRYEGLVKDHDNFVENNIYEGTEELKKLGWVDDAGEVLESAIGTWNEPGPMRILYNALHDESWLPQVEALGPDATRQYHNLRNLADFEENLRKGGGLKLQSFDPDEPLQYFYRGVVPEDLDFKEFNSRVAKYNTATQLGRTSPIEMHRMEKSWINLQEMGLRPLFWNPYSQAMYSSRLGLQVRMQAEFLNLVKNPELDMAKYVEKGTPEANLLLAQGYRALKDVGPAFTNDKFYGVHQAMEELAENASVLKVEGYYLFPSNVANAVEQMFAPKALQWTRTVFKEKWFGGRGLKPDDFIFIPKRADLFASVFQHVDIASRATFGGPSTTVESLIRTGIDLGQGTIDSGTAWKEAFQSFNHTIRVPQVWANMLRGMFSKNYRRELKRQMRDMSEYFPNDPRLKGFSNKASTQNGLHVFDATILSPEEGIKILNDTADELKNTVWGGRIPANAANMIKRMQKFFEEGLFEGWYPAAVLHDYRYNILPMAIKANRGAKGVLAQTPDQIMGLAAKRANILYSTIPESQSVVRGTTREILRRLLFSLNEQEAFLRQFTGMFRGESKAFFASRNIGALVSMAVIANLVHYKTTGETLPTGRYMPFVFKGFYKAGFAYHSQFLNPTIPVPGRSGDFVTLDLMNQYDTVFRIFDGGYGLPIISGLSQRLGTTPRFIMSQATGKDFRGRNIRQWGFLQGALQGIFDLIGPIGLGMIATAAVIRNFGEKKVGGVGTSKFPLIAEGATIGDIFPTEESKLSPMGIALQGITGLNLKAVTGEDLRNQMADNVFGDGEYPGFPQYNTWSEIEDDKDNSVEAKYIAMNHPLNERIVNEMNLRQAEGYRDHYDDATKIFYEQKKQNNEKLQKEIAIVEKYAKDSLWSIHPIGHPDRKPWSPSGFNNDLKDLSSDHRVALDTIEDIYTHDPIAKMIIAENAEEPERSEEPLHWAIWKWNDIRKQHTDPNTGKVDHSSFNDAWDVETSKWDDEEMKETGGLEDRFNNWMQTILPTYSDHHPFIDKKYEAMRELEEAGYWQDGPISGQRDDFSIQMDNLNAVHADTLKLWGTTAEEVWSDYLKETPEMRRVLEDQSVTQYVTWAIVKTMKLVRKNHRYNILISRPDLDQHIIMWKGNQPTSGGNREFYYQLYLKYPSQIRQPPFN